MKVNKKHETITASVTVYATFDMSEVADWFETVRVFMNNGGSFDDYDVDHERYLTHCFDEFE